MLPHIYRRFSSWFSGPSQVSPTPTATTASSSNPSPRQLKVMAAKDLVEVRVEHFRSQVSYAHSGCAELYR